MRIISPMVPQPLAILSFNVSLLLPFEEIIFPRYEWVSKGSRYGSTRFLSGEPELVLIRLSGQLVFGLTSFFWKSPLSQFNGRQQNKENQESNRITLRIGQSTMKTKNFLKFTKANNRKSDVILIIRLHVTCTTPQRSQSWPNL